MPTVERLAVELAADLHPLRQALAEAEQVTSDAVADLAGILAGDGAGDGGIFALLSDSAGVVGQTIRKSLVDAVSGAEVEWDAVISRMALRLSDLAVDRSLDAALAALSGGQGGGTGGGGAGGDGLGQLLGSLFGGFRASGGAVRPDRAYMVGEAGPEFFIPDGSGYIEPQAVATAGPLPMVTINIATPDIAGFRQSQGQVAAALTRALGAARRYT